MKLLTINTHSLLEENYLQKLDWFVEGVLREGPDLIAMQEVNQGADAPEPEPAALAGFVPLNGRQTVPVRRDNHAARVAGRLREAGVPCSWTWLPIKRGYEKYDEGVAVLSLGRSIVQTETFCISRRDDYRNWRTRKILGVRLREESDWYYTVHTGWWQDGEDPFVDQWSRLERAVSDRKDRGPVWLLGDFNAPAEFRGESYDHIRAAGWQDAWLLAGNTGEGFTVEGVIDGWRDRLAHPARGLRMDHIWCSRSVPVVRAQVLFDGKNGPKVSDHFGVLAETEEPKKSEGEHHERV